MKGLSCSPIYGVVILVSSQADFITDNINTAKVALSVSKPSNYIDSRVFVEQSNRNPYTRGLVYKG